MMHYYLFFDIFHALKDTVDKLFSNPPSEKLFGIWVAVLLCSRAVLSDPVRPLPTRDAPFKPLDQ